MIDEFNENAMRAHATGVLQQQLSAIPQEAAGLRSMLQAFGAMQKGKFGTLDFNPALDNYAQGEIAKANAIAKAYRANPRGELPSARTIMGDTAYAGAMAKSTLDVGTLTNLASVTGGQTFGVMSIDMKAARGTVRPRSFTLYNCLNKSMANQIVDYFPYISGIGGQLPGSAYQTLASQQTTPTYNNGEYQLKFLNLKLVFDARALTVALAAQNSFLDIAEQENANAALNILQSANWATYWGNPNFYPTQPQGVYGQLFSRNVINFRTYSVANSSAGLSNQQLMYNVIYETAASVSGYRGYGQITHAFMSNYAMGDLQSLVTAKLDNWLNVSTAGKQGIVVNGDLQGMKTRFGDIQFVQDMFIPSRDIPAQAIVREVDGTNYANASITAPTSVAVAVNAAGAAGSLWDATYAPSASGSAYVYAVVACDTAMNESVLTYSSPVTGVVATGSYTLTITPANAGAQAFRVYRSGLGYAAASNQNPAAFRYIGDVLANGSTAVTFVDLNTKLPGTDTVFLLDLAEEDQALDYRIMLPLSKVELYAQALYMPWAVVHIGAPRLRIPKFCGAVTNYPSARADQWSSLAPNANASTQ